MDALKKAEEEKKQAAKRLQEVEIDAREVTGNNKVVETEVKDEVENKVDNSLEPPKSDTGQFSLEPLSLEEKIEESEKNEIEEGDNVNETEIPTAEDIAFSEELTLENPVTQEMAVQEEFEETQKEIDLNDTTIIEGLSTENASAPYDDTFHGVVFEDEEQETDVYEETLPGVPADQLAKDLGGGKYQPTPVAAKTVFSASRPDKNQSSFKWGIFIVLAILATGSFGIFYYFTITPVSRELPSPLIARGVESSGIESRPIQIPEVIEQSTVNENSSGTIISQDEELSQAEIEVVEVEQQQTEESISSDQETLVQVDTNENVMETDTTDETELVAAEKIEETATSVSNDSVAIEEAFTLEPDSDSELENVESIENTQLDVSLINISKSKNDLKENVAVREAFNAYQNGHYGAAKSLYKSVLKNEPDNRDAHLGLAAIAISEGDRKSAYSHYVHLVELNPLDTLAMSSLIGLSNSADPVQDESAIKLLIQQDDSIPYLYFLLGNLYAKQKRWTSAQQAFFDAYRLDTTNADYVLNLAISLDQLGQYRTALDFYKTAIDLTQHSSSRFDPVSVNQRILTIEKTIEAGS
jgi:tetratricopeptide (TPR) repeat protein